MNKCELEDFILESYDTNVLNTTPKSEKELLNMYQKYTDVLYQYLRLCIDDFMHALNNEIRAILGHLAEYRTIPETRDKRNLDKAYGHFRRLNLDALKILCDEFDRGLSVNLKKQYSYDYRDVCVDYLKVYAERYFKAKHLYIEAQQKERVGCDRDVHNIIELYYVAAKEYILLKKFYDEKKKDILKTKRRLIIKRFVYCLATAFGIVASAIGLFAK